MKKEIFDLIIVGAGASGLMAAGEAHRLGLTTCVLERNKKAGLKLLMCGGGRCNATHHKVTEQDYFSSSKRHIIKHILQHFSVEDCVKFFQTHQAPLRLLEDGCYFSADDKAETILEALLRWSQKRRVQFLYETKVVQMTSDELFHVITDRGQFQSRYVLLSTGGLSYPSTGSDGLGYHIAESFGHHLIKTRPALTSLVTSDVKWKELAGVVVDVRLTLWIHDKKVYMTQGPLLFTHQGFSGPAVLEMSQHWLDARETIKKTTKDVQLNPILKVDFFPKHQEEHINFLFSLKTQQSLKGVLSQYLPKRLIEKLPVDIYRLASDAQWSAEEKKKLCQTLRAYPLAVKDVFGYSKAEITAGGVDLKELKGATLESRLKENLFFSGEILDVNGRIGGFNLHFAWASALAAVRAIAIKKGQ